MSEKWPDCVVTFLDIIDIRKLSEKKRGEASTKMRELHKLANEETVSMNRHSAIYAWNDSVLLLAPLTSDSNSVNEIFTEVSRFKKLVDKRIGKSYAICVKGRTFPEPLKSNLNPKFHALQTSSFAMANCFIIEKELGRYKAMWYVDSRLKASVPKSFKTEKIKLLPDTKTEREILMFMDYFHEAQNPISKNPLTTNFQKNVAGFSSS